MRSSLLLFGAAVLGLRWEYDFGAFDLETGGLGVAKGQPVGALFPAAERGLQDDAIHRDEVVALVFAAEEGDFLQVVDFKHTFVFMVGIKDADQVKFRPSGAARDRNVEFDRRLLRRCVDRNRKDA